MNSEIESGGILANSIRRGDYPGLDLGRKSYHKSAPTGRRKKAPSRGLLVGYVIAALILFIAVFTVVRPRTSEELLVGGNLNAVDLLPIDRITEPGVALDFKNVLVDESALQDDNVVLLTDKQKLIFRSGIFAGQSKWNSFLVSFGGEAERLFAGDHLIFGNSIILFIVGRANSKSIANAAVSGRGCSVIFGGQKNCRVSANFENVQRNGVNVDVRSQLAFCGFLSTLYEFARRKIKKDSRNAENYGEYGNPESSYGGDFLSVAADEFPDTKRSDLQHFYYGGIIFLVGVCSCICLVGFLCWLLFG